MMLNEKELEFDNIISKIGFPITFEDYRATYKYNADIDKVSKFETELRKYLGQDYNKSLETIKNNKEIFDTELYLFHVGRYLEKDYKASKESEILHTKYYPHVYYSTDTIRPTIGRVNYCNNLLKEIDVVDIAINSKNNELIIESSQELFGNKNILKENYNSNLIKIQKIKEQIGIENVLKYLSFENIVDFCNYSNLGNFLAKKCDNQFKTIDNSKTKYFETIIMKYLSYFDLDKMLIISNYNYYKHYMQLGDFSNIGMFELVDFTNQIESIIDNNDSLSIIINNEVINFQSVKLLVTTLRRCFINGKYYSLTQLNDLSKNVISGEVPIELIEKETFKESFSYNSDELLKIIKNKKNLEFLFNNDYLSKDELLKLYDEGNLDNETICQLYELDIINNSFLVNNYLKNKTSIDTIIFILQNSDKKSIENDIVKEFLDDKIRLNDIKKLYENSIISEDMIRKYVLDNNLDISKKIALIYYIFSSKDKSTIKDELLSILIDATNTNEDSLKNQYFKDNSSIWETLSNIDNEYYQTILDDGYILFYLLKKEICIIKKIFSDNNITYGTATFILTNVEFDRNKNLLIINNALNENYLSLLYEDKKAYKIVHTGWGNSFNDFIDNIIFNEQ